MKVAKNKIAVVGDTLLEFSTTTKTLRLGGAGNVALHLSEWFDEVYYFIPYLHSDRLDDHGITNQFITKEYPNINVVEITTGPIGDLPIRIWDNNECCYKMNGNYRNASLSTKEISRNKLILKEMRKFDIENLYVENHFLNNSFAFRYLIGTHDKELDAYSSNLNIYLDSRYPELIPPRFIVNPNRTTWKMNEKEFQKWIALTPAPILNKFTGVDFLLSKAQFGSNISYIDEDKLKVSCTIPATPHPHIQACGCGDSYFTAYVGAKNLGATIIESMTIASIAGGISVSKPEVYLVRPEEIKQYILESEDPLFGNHKLLDYLPH